METILWSWGIKVASVAHVITHIVPGAACAWLWHNFHSKCKTIFASLEFFLFWRFFRPIANDKRAEKTISINVNFLKCDWNQYSITEAYVFSSLCVSPGVCVYTCWISFHLNRFVPISVCVCTWHSRKHGVSRLGNSCRGQKLGATLCTIK